MQFTCGNNLWTPYIPISEDRGFTATFDKVCADYDALCERYEMMPDDNECEAYFLEHGFDGAIFACRAEFFENEFLDAKYMCSLLGDEEEIFDLWKTVVGITLDWEKTQE